MVISHSCGSLTAACEAAYSSAISEDSTRGRLEEILLLQCGFDHFEGENQCGRDGEYLCCEKES